MVRYGMEAPMVEDAVDHGLGLDPVLSRSAAFIDPIDSDQFYSKVWALGQSSGKCVEPTVVERAVGVGDQGLVAASVMPEKREEI